MSKCLITGCTLVIPGEGKTLHGDLHQAGSAMVFNGVLKDGEAAWEYGMEVRENALIVRIPPGFPYFERRGVVVFDQFSADFNLVARDYLGHRG